MSTYLKMWNEIHKLTAEQRTNWITLLRPARGVEVDFNGVLCCDVDLIEALRNAK